MSSNAQRGDKFEGYVPVSRRVEQFYERYPEGRILTAIVEHHAEAGFILMRAEVYRNADDAQPAATGHAFEIRGEGFVNKTSHIENCETGAVGRALANLGFEVKEQPQRPAQRQTERPGPRPVETPPAIEQPTPRQQLIASIRGKAKATQQIAILKEYLETNFKNDRGGPVEKLEELRDSELAEVMAWLDKPAGGQG